MPILFSKKCVANTTQSYAHDSPELRQLYAAARPPPYQDLQAVGVPHFFFIFVSSPVYVSAPLPVILLDVFRSSSSQTPGNYLKLAMNLPSVICISSLKTALPFDSNSRAAVGSDT